MIPILMITKSKKKLYDFLKKKYAQTAHYIVTMQPIKTEYSIDQIRGLSKELIVQRPYTQIYVLEDFDHSSLETQNSFLKLLEEPPEHVQFVLAVSQAYGLLPTVRSRTRMMTIDSDTKAYGDPELNDLLSRTKPHRIMELMGNRLLQCTTRDSAETIIGSFLEYFRKQRTQQPHVAETLKELSTAYRLIRYNNANPQLSIDHLLIFIAKEYSIK